MVSTAGIELKLGDASGEKDAYLRAHNLASQAVEKYKLLMEWQEAIVLRKQQPKSWWSRLFEQETPHKVFALLDIHSLQSLPAFQEQQDLTGLQKDHNEWDV